MKAVNSLRWRKRWPTRSVWSFSIAQAKGRAEIFQNYRLRVAGVIRDYGMLEREPAPRDSRQLHG
jgi:hypothetical protein